MSKKSVSSKEKLLAVLEILSDAKSLDDVAKEFGITKEAVRLWKNQFLNNGHTLFEKKSTHNSNETKLKKELERKDKEIQLLKKLSEHFKLIQNQTFSKSRDSS